MTDSMRVLVDSDAIRVVSAGTQGPAGPPSLSPDGVITTEGDMIIGGTGGTPEAQNFTSSVKAIPGNALSRLSQKIAEIADSPPAQVTWLTWGDSLAQLKYVTFYTDLARSLGGDVGCYFPGTAQGITTNASTGTITDDTASFDVWPTGLVSTFATSATRTYGRGGSTTPSDTFTLYYVKESGAGTFTIQCDGVDTTAVGVSADNASTALGITTVSVAQGSHEFKVICVTGTVRVIGCGVIDTTRSGLVTANIAQGGLSLHDAMGTATARTMLQGVLADINPAVISHEMKEESSYYATDLATLFGLFTAGASDANVIGIGSTPVSGDDADQVIQNTQLRAACDTFGFVYWDGYGPFGSYAALTALGWEGDGTHVNTAASSYLSGIMLRDLGILSDLNQNVTRDVVADVAILGDELLFGDPNDPFSDPTVTMQRTDSNLDLTITGKRNIVFTGTNGTRLKLAVSGGDVNVLPPSSELGSGHAHISGYDANLASISLSANPLDYGDIGLRVIAPLVVLQTLATPGAVTIDPSTGMVQRVMLQANASSITIQSGGYNGLTVQVWIMQDGTGGHTFTWPTSGVEYAGGSAPTPTTTANRMDIVTFARWNTQSKWYEVSRSINVPI